MKRSRPRIGIDARKLTDFGIGSYVRHLVEAIARRPEASRYEFRLYVRGEDREALPALADNFSVVEEE